MGSSLSPLLPLHEPSKRVRPLYGRLAWLDELRLVAIVLMVVDHALFFFARDEEWAGLVRLLLTRCAEPLFVFVLTYLAIYLQRSMKLSRWLQIAAVSVITSAVLSQAVGFWVADVLVSIALAVPMLMVPIGGSIPVRWFNLVLLYASAMLATAPVQVAGIHLDYSPVLIVHQIALTRLFAYDPKRWIVHATIATALAGGASLCMWDWLGIEPTAAVFTVLFGHPLAALVVAVIRRQGQVFSTPLTRLARMPLRIYALHLAAFAALATITSSLH